MRRPSFYSPPPDGVDIRETHTSMVFLAGDRAYKLKKPVQMPFLDYSTAERRRHFCREEVRLNSRFAPDVYLGVQAVAPRDGELGLAAEDAPGAVDYVVVMRRLDEDATLERLVERGAADASLAARIGRAVAAIHMTAERTPGYWSPGYVAGRLRENFDTTAPDVGALIDPLTFDSVKRFATAFLDGHVRLFEQRAAAGAIRDAHGDLRAEHIVVESGQLTIVDCIEFDDCLRRIDVAADLAFLTMDLERLGARDLAGVVERAYAERTGDGDLSALMPFYGCYRAWVRGKVAALRLRQLGPRDPEREALAARACDLFALAQRLAWRSRLPLVLVFCGVGATGKSTIAAELHRRTGLPHVSSDRVRKELAGIPVGERAAPSLYADEHTRRTYAELGRQATTAVGSHGGAIVDATFSTRAHRTELSGRLRPSGARILWLECAAPPDVLRRRAAARAARPEHGSDATWPVIAAQLEAREPLDELEPANALRLCTDRPLEDCLDEVDRFVSAACDR